MKFNYRIARLILITFCSLQAIVLSGQGITLYMTLEKVVEDARTQSLSALIAKHNYIVSYWEFRTYKAQFLPSLYLSGGVGEYNRSITRMQDAETGEFHYVNNNFLSNSLNLELKQNIPFTGGTISLNTYLDRTDQFSPKRSVNYNAQPIYMSYDQPLFAYNRLKWEKKIEPVKYEKAKREYLENVEEAVTVAVEYFFNLLLANENMQAAIRSKENNTQLLAIAEERYKLGNMTRDELLQLRLQLLNDDVKISDYRLEAEMAMIRLRTFLGYNEKVTINPLLPSFEENLVLDLEEVLGRAEKASSEYMDRKIKLLEAESAVAQAKAQRGFEASLYARFGTTQVGKDLGSAYRSPMDQEVVGLSLRIPILDWGLGKGRVLVAKSQQEVMEMQVNQQSSEWIQDLTMKVLEFNLQGNQCRTSMEADAIGKERYSTARNRFTNGAISVTELNTAQSEMDNSSIQYIEKICKYWTSYFELRRLCLYDYIGKQEVTEDFDKLTGD